MKSLLIKDTTREERERIVADSIGNIDGACDGCAAGLAEMYRDYIDGDPRYQYGVLRPARMQPGHMISRHTIIY